MRNKQSGEQKVAEPELEESEHAQQRVGEHQRQRLVWG